MPKVNLLIYLWWLVRVHSSQNLRWDGNPLDMYTHLWSHLLSSHFLWSHFLRSHFLWWSNWESASFLWPYKFLLWSNEFLLSHEMRGEHLLGWLLLLLRNWHGNVMRHHLRWHHLLVGLWWLEVDGEESCSRRDWSLIKNIIRIKYLN